MHRDWTPTRATASQTLIYQFTYPAWDAMRGSTPVGTQHKSTNQSLDNFSPPPVFSALFDLLHVESLWPGSWVAIGYDHPRTNTSPSALSLKKGILGPSACSWRRRQNTQGCSVSRPSTNSKICPHRCAFQLCSKTLGT